MSALVRALVGAGVGAVVLAVLGFGLTRDARELPAVSVGRPAPAFALTSLAGSTVRSEDMRGRPMVINFWASWCTECRKEHPLLMAAHDRLGDRVSFVGVVFQDSAANARNYLVEMGDVPAGSYPNLLDPSSQTAIDYGVYGVPETFFIDRQGRIVAKRVGRVTLRVLERELRRIMQ